MKPINSNYGDDRDILICCYVCEKDTDETTININEDKRVHGSIYFADVICEDCK